MISGLWQQGQVKIRPQNEKKNRNRRRLRLWLLLALVVSAGLLTGFLYGADWRQHLAVPFYSSSRQNHSFQESTGYHANPFMGAVAFAKNRSSLFEGTIVVGGFTWAEIEATRGLYDFTAVERRNNYHYWVNDKERQFMLGFSMDYPSASRAMDYDHLDIPRWLYEELKKEAEAVYAERLSEARRRGEGPAIRAYEDALHRIRNDDAVMADFNRLMKDNASIPGVGTFYRYSKKVPDSGIKYWVGFSPNYASAVLVEQHDRVLQAIAERYDHEDTYCIIMGSLGHWGEMHTYYILDRSAAGYYPGNEIASPYEQAYARFFQNTLVSSRQPREVARDNNFGLHNHSFGHPQHTYEWFIDWFENGYTCFYTGDRHPAMPDFWKRAPSGAEIYSTGDYRFLTDTLIESTLQQAKDSYLTWVLEPWVALSPQGERNMERLLETIGYRFAITEAAFNTRVAAGDNIALTTTWRNGGTAPFYHDWPIVVQLQDRQGRVVSEATISPSVRNLFPQAKETYRTSLEVPAAVSPGTYELWVGILDPETRQAGIRLAVENAPEIEGLLRIGEIEISDQNDLSAAGRWLQDILWGR